ncbi:hypothetical protein HYR54_12710 [Candidatus Acetothermia bacterium]|nr:hypothetical protein [Candidatus Acetothermia bacterium]
MNVKNSLKLLVVLSLLAFSTAVAAQPVSSFHVFVEKQASNYFFSVQGENVASTRVEVLGLNGRPIFDSGWILGQTVAWPLMTLNGQPAANGVYLYAISVRDQQGKEQRKLGKLAIVQGLKLLLSTPDVDDLVQVQPMASGAQWKERLAKDGQDNFRILRNGAALLTLDSSSRLTVAQLCLAGDCRNVWPAGGGPTLAWLLSGNAGTTAGTNFLGTTDNVALELKVNSQRALRIEPGSTPNLIEGFSGNFAGAGVVGAAIGGGGANGTNNRVLDDFSTIGGGLNNQAGDGNGSTADHELATVGGGAGNQATGNNSTVGGGLGNTASGGFSTIPGGMFNTALGDFSFAAGRRAKANNQGSFVWADNSVDADFASTADNQFLIRASKVGIGTTTPGYKLDVNGVGRFQGLEGGASSGAGVEIQYGNVGGATRGIVFAFDRSAGAPRDLLLNHPGGNVGIGTTSPSAGLTVRDVNPSALNFVFRIEDSTGAQLFAVDDIGRAGTKSGFTVGAFAPATTTHVCRTTAPPSGPGILAECSSAAEYVPTVEDSNGYPETGDLVRVLPSVKNPFGDKHSPFVVTKTSKPCDSDLLGFLLKPELGADGPKLNEHYRPLAIFGYFPAKVTMENGTIKRGDPITSSSKPGYGMKATQACKIIGYALEDADREGTIQIFAHLSESAAPEVTALRAQVQELHQQLQQVLSQLDAIKAKVGSTPIK